MNLQFQTLYSIAQIKSQKTNEFQNGIDDLHLPLSFD